MLRFAIFSLPFLLRAASRMSARVTSWRRPAVFVVVSRAVKRINAGLSSVGGWECRRLVTEPPTATLTEPDASGAWSDARKAVQITR